MPARSASPVLVTVLDTPAGPLSLLTCDDTLVGAGFTGDPESLHARLEPALREAPPVSYTHLTLPTTPYV